MIPALTVPELTGNPESAIETRPAKVEKWLADLPVLNPEETSRRIYIALMTLNRLDLDNKTRFKLLELYRGPVKRLAVELQKEYVGRPLPLFTNNKMQAEQNRKIHEELATGYKRIIVNLAISGKVKANHTDNFLATTIERAISCLTEVLVKCYLYYADVPPDTWREMHELYLFACYSGNASTEVKDPFNTAMVTTTATNRYKQALLLGLCNPYHLPAHTVEKVNHYLDRWAHLAQIAAPEHMQTGLCEFLIDQGNDEAGRLFVQDADINKCKQCSGLYTRELVKHLHTQLTDLQAGNELEDDGLEAGFYTDTAETMIAPLINAWGVNPKRQFPRKHVPETQVNIAIGIKPVNYFLNGGYLFVPSSKFVYPQPERTSIGHDSIHGLHIQDSNITMSHWRLTDESASGIALKNNNVKNEKIRVGELVAYRSAEGQHDFEIGVIRWMKNIADDAIEIGLKRLAPQGQSAVVKIINEDGGESDFLPVVMLPEITAMNQPPTLIAHKGIHKYGRILYLDDGISLRKIEAKKPLEETAIFTRFVYGLVDA